MQLDDVSTWSVLIIDDEPDNIDVVVVCLEFQNATAKSATGGAEAIDILQEFQPTFILLDLTMPGIDGWELHQRIRAEPKTSHIPIIALTAHAMEGDKERVLAAGFNGYISKPIEVLTFVDTVRAILALRDSSEQVAENT